MILNSQECMLSLFNFVPARHGPALYIRTKRCKLEHLLIILVHHELHLAGVPDGRQGGLIGVNGGLGLAAGVRVV